MTKIATVAVATLSIALAVVASILFFKPSMLGLQSATPQSAPLSFAQVEKVLLYAALKDGQLIGTYFNRNPDVTVTQITVEAVPRDEGNPFNKFAPRFFNVSAIARPNSMSTDFRVETGVLNPESHTLRVTEGKGRATP